jgi:hypothetical protein
MSEASGAVASTWLHVLTVLNPASYSRCWGRHETLLPLLSLLQLRVCTSHRFVAGCADVRRVCPLLYVVCRCSLFRVLCAWKQQLLMAWPAWLTTCLLLLLYYIYSNAPVAGEVPMTPSSALPDRVSCCSVVQANPCGSLSCYLLVAFRCILCLSVLVVSLLYVCVCCVACLCHVVDCTVFHRSVLVSLLYVCVCCVACLCHVVDCTVFHRWCLGCVFRWGCACLPNAVSSCTWLLLPAVASSLCRWVLLAGGPCPGGAVVCRILSCIRKISFMYAFLLWLLTSVLSPLPCWLLLFFMLVVVCFGSCSSLCSEGPSTAACQYICLAYLST